MNNDGDKGDHSPNPVSDRPSNDAPASPRITLVRSALHGFITPYLGLFAMGVGMYSIFNPTLHRTISAWWSVPAGVIGGAIATVFGAGGPVYATYLSGRLKDKTEIRSTMSALISISAFTRAVVYAVSGLLHVATFAGFAVLAPFVWAGLKLGHRIHVGLSQEQMRRVVGAVLVLTGGSLLVRRFL